MKNLKILIFLLALFTSHQNKAQRTLQIIEEDAGWSRGITYQDKAYFYHDGNAYFTSYDGESLNRFTFPLRGGNQLIFQPSRTGIAVFDGKIYLILQKFAGRLIDDMYLYSFNGNTFSPLSLPGKLISNPVVYKGKLYVMVDMGSTVKLFSYDGELFREVPSSSATSTPFEPFELQVAGQFLYIKEPGFSSFDLATVKRFDGSNFLTIPGTTISIGKLKVLAVPGTEEIYFLSRWNIAHFDGHVTSVIHDGSNLESFSILNGILYFEGATFIGPPDNIYKYDGSSLSLLSLPEGARLMYGTAITVFENKLLIPAELPDGSFWVYEYDGSTFQRNFEIPGAPVYGYGWVRAGKYLLATSSTERLEYDGTSYIKIDAPEGRKITDFITSTSCFHLWNVYHYPEGSDGIPVVDIAKEDLGCPPKAVFIIPERLRRFLHVGMGVNGRYRDWCWTDLFWDFKIDPICPIPEVCPDPVFGVSLTGPYGKEVWAEKFEKPFHIQFPFEDKQAYTLALSSTLKKSKEALFIFDDDLVKNGISALNLSMVPQKDYFLLSAETDKGEKVPFVMSLLNKEGKTIWEEKFTAPMKKEITAYVDEPGATLQFSSVPREIKDLKQYGITEINIYPNPSKGKLSVEMETNDKKVPTVLAIADLKGRVVWKKEVVAPGRQNIDLSNRQPGLYIMTITVGKARMSEQIKLE